MQKTSQTTTRLILAGLLLFSGCKSEDKDITPLLALAGATGTDSSTQTEPGGTNPIEAAAPSIEPVAGVYAAAQDITISSTNTGDTFCFTSDGTEPDCNGGICSNGTAYSSPVNIAASQTIKAIACKDGLINSAVVAVEYVIDSAAPVPGNSGTITKDAVLATSASIAWAAASDDTALSYQVYYSTADNISTAADIIANGTPFGTASDKITETVTGLSGATSYWLNILVTDAAGNQSVYTSFSLATTNTTDNGDGTVYVHSQNLTWAKCSQSTTTGGNMYSATADNCSNGTASTLLQFCNQIDNSCDDGTILNGTGSSTVWNTCNSLPLAGRSWRAPTLDELNAFYTVYSADKTMFPNVAIIEYWSASTSTFNATLYAVYVSFVTGINGTNNKNLYRAVRCVSDGN